MITHIVLFTLKDHAEGRTKQENIDIAVDIASTFVRDIPGCLSTEIKVKAPGSPDDNEDIALICTFPDLDALQVYKVHPQHVAFGKHITAVRKKRTCFDFEGEL